MRKGSILRVNASNEEIKNMYGAFSKFYSLIEKFENSLRKKSFKYLNLKKGDIILEVGFGTGTDLIKMAKYIGEKGIVYGIDLTPEMVTITKRRVFKNGLLHRVKLYQGDAKKLPFQRGMFDTVYMASTLELFDTPDIPIVLEQVKKVLKKSGKLVIASLTRKDTENLLGIKLYEWFHKNYPKYASCRPIYVNKELNNAGFKIIKSEIVGSFLPMEIVLATL